MPQRDNVIEEIKRWLVALAAVCAAVNVIFPEPLPFSCRRYLHTAAQSTVTVYPADDFGNEAMSVDVGTPPVQLSGLFQFPLPPFQTQSPTAQNVVAATARARQKTAGLFFMACSFRIPNWTYGE